MAPSDTFPPVFDSFKSAWFGDSLQRTVPGLLRAKALVYRYCVFIDSLSIINTGYARGYEDFIVATRTVIGHSGEAARPREAGTFMHELGHTLWSAP
jgi:hypothetical protein